MYGRGVIGSLWAEGLKIKMELNILTGGVSSGKTTRLAELAEATLRKFPEHKIIVTVPEQLSFSTEKKFIHYFGGLGLNNIEVLSFSRLIHRYAKRVNSRRLSPEGKNMLIYRAAASLKDGDGIFSGCIERPGFLNSAADIITEMKRYMITPEQLKKTSESIQNQTLQRKLSAISEIYEEYNRLTDGRFADSEEEPMGFAEYVLSSDEFVDTHIWFDEFSDFLPQHYMIIEALLLKAASVNVSLCITKNPQKHSDTFNTVLNTRSRLISLAKKHSAEVKEISLDNVGLGIKSAEIRHFLNNYNAFGNADFEEYPEKTRDIRLFAARDLYSEVEHTAREIRRLVIDGGCKYRDIAVICGSFESYRHIIEAVLEDFEIPYFTDCGIEIMNHPIITLVMSALEILTENWSYASVFRYLRTGFIYRSTEEGVTPLPFEDIDIVENFVLKYGIKGKKAWLEGISSGAEGIFDTIIPKKHEAEEETERISEICAEITRPFRALAEKMSGRKPVRELAEALFEFLCEIHLYEGLCIETKALADKGLRTEAMQFKQIWDTLVEVINQTVVTMGEAKCLRSEFAELLRAGLMQSSIAVIPPGNDRVSVGSADRARPGNVRAIFVIGAEKGALPKEMQNEGMLSNRDRAEISAVLAAEGLEIGADTKRLFMGEQFKLYRILFAASEKLFVSYPLSSSEGKSVSPSALIGDLYRVFPSITLEEEIITAENEADMLYSPKTAFNYMISRQYAANTPLYRRLFEWYSSREEWKTRLSAAERANIYKKSEAKITPENAQRLYEAHQAYSVSRLNAFGDCPFGYFVKYGLKAEEPEIRGIHKLELGSVMHLAVYEYCRAVERGAKTLTEVKERWETMTEEQSAGIISGIMEDFKSRILSSITRDTERVSYIIMRMTKILLRSVELIRKSLAEGEYTAVCYEADFSVRIEWRGSGAEVNGTIDRVDLLERKDEGIADIRIIDYKSGKKDFDVISICNRRDMQLIVYAIAAVEMYNSGKIPFSAGQSTARIGGVMYSRLRDDMTKIDAAEVENAEEIAKSTMKLSGVTVTDESPIDAYRAEDRGIEEKGKSDIVNISLTKSGTAKRGSEVMSRADFTDLMRYVKKSIADTDRAVKNGVISISPCTRKDFTVCEYCGYSEICLLDKLLDKPKRACESVETAWKIIKEEVGENGDGLD